MDAEQRVQDLWDSDQIRSVTYRYGRALDDRNWDLLRTCFTAEATADFGPWGQVAGVEAIVGAAAPVMEGLDQTQHVMTDHAIELGVDRESATSVCNLVAEHLLVTPEGSSTSTTRGIYRDRWVRTPEGWRITHRQLEVTWREGNTGIFDLAMRRASVPDSDNPDD